jgi:acyl dehydratase
VETKPSTSKPDRGMARIKYRIKNQSGEDVITFAAMQLLRRKST